MARSTVDRPKARYCAFCASNTHTLCTGSGGATGAGSCECGDRGHDPEVRVAAAMRLHQSPNLLGLDEVELANGYRRNER